ncbi:MAG TPA: PH domain-containing protein [Candidatus Limnocylindrales bacterium]|nr:PH domain-containing protein [Candidatus Limnocylindrales bacterium]
MVTFSTVEEQLKAIGCNFRFWGRSELKELAQVLLPGETIAQCVNGSYDAGFAMLCATDFRVLLIDKKPKYLTLKDIRYDMITELDFSNRLLDSTIRIYTPNKELRFTTPSAKRLRKLFSYTQHKVMEIRHHFMIQQFQQLHDARNTPPGLIMSEMMQQGQLQPMAASGQLPTHATEANGPSDEHNRLASAMGAAGLRSIVHNGQVVKEYMTVPFTQRWRKRPYGFSNNALPKQAQNEQASAQ